MSQEQPQLQPEAELLEIKLEMSDKKENNDRPEPKKEEEEKEEKRSPAKRDFMS